MSSKSYHQRSEVRARLREARLEQQAREHAEMRERLRKHTSDAVNCLTELRVQHVNDGHFVNGFYVTGASRRDVEAALEQPHPVPRKNVK